MAAAQNASQMTRAGEGRRARGHATLTEPCATAAGGFLDRQQAGHTYPAQHCAAASVFGAAPFRDVEGHHAFPSSLPHPHRIVPALDASSDSADPMRTRRVSWWNRQHSPDRSGWAIYQTLLARSRPTWSRFWLEGVRLQVDDRIGHAALLNLHLLLSTFLGTFVQRRHECIDSFGLRRCRCSRYFFRRSMVEL